ncbi:MAG: GNAT family N-acetyltransferase [Pseudomonadota bacterium]
MSLTIRLAEPADISRAAETHIASCLVTYRGIAPDSVVDGPMEPSLREIWAAETLPPPDFMVIAEEAGRVVGLVVARPGPEHGDYPYVEHFHILPGRKGAGIGRRLLARLQEELKARGATRFHLHVTEGNDGAFAFYRAMGGVVGGAVEGDLFGHPVPSRVVRWTL